MTTANIRNRVAIPMANHTVETCSFNDLCDPKEHIALIFHQADEHEQPFVRLHSECLTGDVFGSKKCDCGNQLQETIKVMQHHGGVILYLRQEGRGIGLYNKLDAYALQNQGLDTYQANEKLNFQHDLRDYHAAAQMLFALNISHVRLISNNPDKHQQLEHYGINVVERISTSRHNTPNNNDYLNAKIKISGHQFKQPNINNYLLADSTHD
ncbi:MAG: GTP cyclohydrolase II [Coxiellaceae bacterium]|nr:GTP cyclohydrolase II [Coxiellaceae bacterium]